MTIFNLIMAIAALALFVVLVGQILKRIKSLEFHLESLYRSYEKLSEGYNNLKNQLNDVRKSLDNF